MRWDRLGLEVAVAMTELGDRDDGEETLLCCPVACVAATERVRGPLVEGVETLLVPECTPETLPPAGDADCSLAASTRLCKKYAEPQVHSPAGWLWWGLA